MKKLLSLVLVLILTLALAACGEPASSDGEDDETKSKKKTGTDVSDAEQSDAETDTSETETAQAATEPTTAEPTTAEPTTAADASEYVTDANGNEIPANAPTEKTGEMKLKFDSEEYKLYNNVMALTEGGYYEGKEVTKDGVFAVLQDDWSGTTRYYVWGYADTTMCCDYQWEFVPKDVSALPTPGSYITVTGMLSYTAEQKTGAMDHYWITDADVKVQSEFTPADYDYDLTTMSNTLAYVQIMRMRMYPDAYNGKTVRVFGRTLDADTLQHPYYNEVWNLDFAADKSPGDGVYLILGGTLDTTVGHGLLKVTEYTEVNDD